MSRKKKNAVLSIAPPADLYASEPVAVASPPPVRRRWLISLLLLVHLTAVFIAPFSFASSGQPGQGSPLAGLVMETLRPYIDFAYLNHGYFFFAPNPGASHLVRYRAVFDDDRPPLELTFPDRQRHWPRLLYHRHFMLSEALNSNFVPPEIPPESISDPDQQARWRRQREVYEAMWASYRRHLIAAHGATHVELTRIEHRPPTPWEWVADGKRLRDADLYSDMPEVFDVAATEVLAPPPGGMRPVFARPTPLQPVDPSAVASPGAAP
jgi:hypothetical protein